MGDGKDERIGIGGVFPADDPDGSKAKAELDKVLGVDKPCFVGLDLSITSTGMAIKRGDVVTMETIKTTPKTCSNDLARMIYIRDVIMGKIPVDVKMVGVEDFFTPHGPQVGAAIRIAMLGAVVRLALYEKGMSFLLVAPTSLKKYITGKGVGQKDMIVREVYRRLNLTAGNDDEADGAVLCYIAEHFHNVLRGEVVDAPKYQQEVIKNLMTSRSERGFNLSEWNILENSKV